jgi:hypothetical protein
MRLTKQMQFHTQNTTYMKTLVAILAATIIGSGAMAQNDNFYYSTGGEIILSAADISIDGNDITPVVRFTAFLHMEHYLNYDIANTLGIFSGLGMRNVGFIYDQTQEIRKKHRVYTLGIPIGMKLGKLDEYFFYGGYEIEFPFNYKEKTFQNNNKEKFNEWFSPRTPTYYNTAFLGIHFSERFSVKFKYYFDNFFDQDFTQNGTRPYEDFNANMFYISLGTKLVRD